MNAKLFEINPITFEIEPAVAEEHQIAPDGSALTLTLREIQFSDGTPLTADDVLFTINDVVLNTEIQSDRLSSLRQFLTSRDGQLMIQEAEKLDQRQLRLRLNGGVGAFVLKQLSENFVILPRHKLADSVRRLNPRASADAFVKAWSLQARPEEFAGLGPFRLKALKKTGIPLISEQISGLNFERNPFYWKADSNGVQLPYVDKVSLDFVANPRADIPAKIQAGQVDAALLEVDFMNVKIADGQNFLRAASQAGFSLIYQGPSLSTSFLAFNQDVPDEALRQVFREVRFRQAVAHLVDYERIEREALQNFGVARETFLRPESPFFDPQANVRFEFDPNRAAAHLDELGFKDTNGDGIRELPNGQPYHFYKFSDARGEDVADYQKRLDEILFEQAVELDRAKRRALSTEMQRLLSDNLPVIWLYSPATLVVARPTLGNTGAVKTIEAAFNLMETLWRKDQ